MTVRLYEIAAGASALAMTCKTKPVIASEFTSVAISRMEHVRRPYMTTVKFHFIFLIFIRV